MTKVMVLAVQRQGNGGAMSSGNGSARKEVDDGCGGHRGSRRRLTRVDGGLAMKVFAILGFGLLQVRVGGSGGVCGCDHDSGGAVMARREWRGGGKVSREVMSRSEMEIDDGGRGVVVV
ncbi:hypothetical protein LR48_Vigan10g112500 [Vigna angularis]|uniref:Uncharacterized protein n=1 Tax=Phaseolus angularis TaxID=3914 RepID=A0A0L9VJR7_PHAAN|nr:hypothetical protein LR48_Vigan10g112500 [Vigna angularis]